MLLVIDNYDSFTYNLVQYFGELGQDVKVFRNDEITLQQIEELKPQYLVVSPAPARPTRRACRFRPSCTLPASCPSWAYAWATRA